jgi:RNA polymerase sigma-70 factor (ECF subfamily)
MTDDDASLVARARLGDAAAFGTLLRRHFRAAYLVALAQVGNDADAEDVCQDAFVRCWERLPDCREPSRFGGWLVRIVRNTAHNRREYLRVREVEPAEVGANVASPVFADTAFQTAELRDLLLQALARLTLVQREVVLLHDLEGWLHAAIAERLGLSEVMSRRHLSDARRKLRQLLGDYATLEPDHD